MLWFRALQYTVQHDEMNVDRKMTLFSRRWGFWTQVSVQILTAVWQSKMGKYVKLALTEKWDKLYASYLSSLGRWPWGLCFGARKYALCNSSSSPVQHTTVSVNWENWELWSSEMWESAAPWTLCTNFTHRYLARWWHTLSLSVRQTCSVFFFLKYDTVQQCFHMKCCISAGKFIM